jgi:hypothetical protein
MLAVMSFVAYSAAVLIGKGALKALFFCAAGDGLRGVFV